MSNIEFLKFEKTPSEKYLGIVTIRAYGKIILRYKIIPTKDGSSFFAAPSTYKMPATIDRDEHYISAFMLDSISENEECMAIIKSAVRRILDIQPSEQKIDSYQQQLQSDLNVPSCPF